MNTTSKLKIKNVRVERSIYEQNINFQHTPDDPSIDFNIDLLINKSNDALGIVRLSCIINHNKNFEDIPFFCEVAILGDFHVEEGKFEDYVLNAISILFPYIRTHISTITAISGIDPFLIPSINIVELLKTKAEDNIN